VCDFSEGLAAVVKDGKLGFVDTTGKVVIPLTYDCSMYEEFYFNHGLAVVAAGDFETLISLLLMKTATLPLISNTIMRDYPATLKGCWLLLSVEIGVSAVRITGPAPTTLASMVL